MKCRLTSGKEPTVQYSWFHNGELVRKGSNFKIKSRKSGSVLNIRGLPETAGVYTCMATNLAGGANMSSTLYVHGSVQAACGAAYCLNGGLCSVAMVAPGEHEAVCNCMSGYAGARCELKHVTGMLTGDMVIVILIILGFTATILLLINSNTRLRRLERTEQNRKCDVPPPLTPSKDKQKLQNGNIIAPTHDFQHCGYVRAAPRSSQARPQPQVTKSASSPGMQLLATTHTPPCSDPASPTSTSLLHLLGSSHTSVQSAGSVKNRRAGAPDNLVIHITAPAKSEVLPGEEQSSPPPVPSPSPSPLYMEPWDKASFPCIHGTGDIQCSVCHREAENIVTQCNTYSSKIYQ